MQQIKQSFLDEKTILFEYEYGKENLKLQEIPSPLLDQSVVNGKEVLLSGRIPHWLYMRLALECYQAGAEKISVRQVQLKAPVCIYPCDLTAECGNKNVIISEESDYLFLEYRFQDNHGIKPEKLPEYLSNIPVSMKEDSRIVLSGRIANYLAAAAAIRACQNGWTKIEWWTPINPAIYQIWPELIAVNECKPLAQRGKIIGVVGDPNSGKSIFSELLERSGQNMKQQIWRYDCDYSAPTPNWFLSICRDGRTEEGKAIRSKYKRKWTPEAEEEIAATLKSVSWYYPYVIADLPGGIHHDDGRSAERIPAGRERIMEVIDAFIILAREDIHSDEAWRTALQAEGLDQRIKAVVFSADPAAEISFTVDPAGKAVVTGLSRDHSTDHPELFAPVWKYTAEKL